MLGVVIKCSNSDSPNVAKGWVKLGDTCEQWNRDVRVKIELERYLRKAHQRNCT